MEVTSNIIVNLKLSSNSDLSPQRRGEDGELLIRANDLGKEVFVIRLL